MTYAIRPARLDDVPHLGPVEVKAGEMFRGIGLDDLAGDFMAPEMAASFVRTGGCFVAVHETDGLAGFAMASPLDRAMHLHEMSVDPAHGRLGLGGRLLETIAGHAQSCGFAAVTLSTFSDVAWNAPFYARHGYAIVAPEAWTPGFFILHQREADAGLPLNRRCFMRKEL